MFCSKNSGIFWSITLFWPFFSVYLDPFPKRKNCKFRRSNNWRTHWEFTYLGKVKAIVWLCIGFIGSPWRPPTRLNYFSSTSSWMAVYKGMYDINGCISMKIFQLLLCLLFEGVPLLIKVPQQNPVNFELKRNWNFNSSAI